MSRIVAKKIVSWLKCSLSRLPFFTRDLEQNFSPHSSVMHWMWGYQASHLQDGKRSSRTCWKSVQNKILFQFLYLFALIFKVVRNLFTTFHLHGSSWFRYWTIAHAHNLNTFCCPLESVGQQNSASNYLFFYWQIPRQLAVNDYPLHGCISLGWSEWSIALNPL